MGTWSYLKGTFPFLPEDPSRQDGLTAQITEYRRLPLADLAATYNDLKEEMDERKAEVKELQLRLDAAEIALRQHMDEANLESVVAAGFKWTPKIDVYPSVKDKSAFQQWILKHMPDNVTINPGTLKNTVKGMLEENVPLPDGVEIFLKHSFSRTAQK